MINMSNSIIFNEDISEQNTKYLTIIDDFEVKGNDRYRLWSSQDKAQEYTASIISNYIINLYKGESHYVLNQIINTNRLFAGIISPRADMMCEWYVALRYRYRDYYILVQFLKILRQAGFNKLSVEIIPLEEDYQEEIQESSNS